MICKDSRLAFYDIVTSNTVSRIRSLSLNSIVAI